VTTPNDSATTQAPNRGLRLVVALLLATLSVFVVIPTVLGLFIVVAIGVVVGVAFVLGHTGDLQANAFEPAHTAAIVGLVSTLLALYAVRTYARATRRVAETWAHLAVAPPVTVGLFLGLGTVLLTRARWGGSAWVAPALSTSFVLASAYFVLGLCIFGAVMGTGRLILALYRWSTATAYRAGLATGLLIAALVPTVVSLRSNQQSMASQVAPATLAPSAVDGVRGALVAVHKAASANDAPSSVPPQFAVATTGLTPEAQPPDEERWRQCAEVFAAEEARLRQFIATHYRLSADDAHDVVRDAMVSVCVAYVAGTPYERLGAVFQTSAEREAKDDFKRRRHLRCAIEPGEDLKCERASHDLDLLVGQQRALVDRAMCAEPRSRQDVFYLRVHEGLDFRAIGERTKMTETEARDTFANLAKKLKKTLAEKCGP